MTRCGIATAILLGLLVPPATAAQPTVRLKIIQRVENGKDGLMKMDRVGSLAVHGGFLYVSSPAALNYFKRTPSSGRLIYAGELAWQAGAARSPIAFAGGRMYHVAAAGKRDARATLVWYEVEPRTGRPVEKGKIDCPKSVALIVAPDEKTLYLKTNVRAKSGASKILWYRLDNDGKPGKGREVAGKGLGPSTKPVDTVLQMSADGRHLYSISGAEHAIGWVERKLDGSLAYKGSVDLEKIGKNPVKGYAWPSLAISPDGQYVYVNQWGYQKKDAPMGIYKRDPETGTLTFQATSKLPRALKGMGAVFEPDGTAMYCASLNDPVMWLGRDPKTGRLKPGGRIAETGLGRANPRHLALDAACGVLYAGCGYKDVLYVLSTGRRTPAAK